MTNSSRAFEIGDVSKQELADVVALEARCFGGQQCINHLVTRQVFDVSPEHFLVARTPKVVGYIASLLCSDRKSAWIITLGVDPEHRESGVATALVQETFQRLIMHGITECCLTVRPDNSVVRALCEREGFAQTGVEEDYFGVGEKRIVLRKHF